MSTTLTHHDNYMRVAANVYDSDFAISEIYAIAVNAFTSSPSDEFVKNHVTTNKSEANVFSMFNPDTGNTRTSLFGESLPVIAYITLDTDNNKISGTNYNVYIYTMNTVNYVRLQYIPGYVTLPVPDLSVDWATQTIVDFEGTKIDDIEIRNGKVTTADARDYSFHDNDSVLRMEAKKHAQTVNGVPAILATYDGDLSIVSHVIAFAPSENSLSLTSIRSDLDTKYYYRSGWQASLYNNNLQILIGRGEGNDIKASKALAQTPPYSDSVHTFGCVYKFKVDGTDQSSLELYWDGVLQDTTTANHFPIDWSGSDNIYMGRFFDYPIKAVTYQAGFKLFKSALTSEEMTTEYNIRPTYSDVIPASEPTAFEVKFGEGWRMIKELAGNSTSWYPNNDNLLGEYGTYTEFLFTHGDFSKWLITDKSQVHGTDTTMGDGTLRLINSSSKQDTPYQVKWFNRAGSGGWIDYDPWISIEDHPVGIVYGEGSSTHNLSYIGASGMFVYVR